MAGENLPLELQLRLEKRAAEAQVKAFADQTQDRFSKIKIGFSGGSFKAGSAALGKISQDADQFEKSMAAANARVLAFGTAVGVIEGMRRSFLALVKTTTDVEAALTRISVVAGKDFEKAGITIDQVGNKIFQIAKEVGQGWETTAKATLEFSRQGLGVQESLKRTRDALILTRISGVDYKEAVDGLTSTLNAFRQAGLDSTTVINKLVAVDNAAAVSVTDLIEGLQRFASVSQLTGQNIDQTIAAIATLQEITARGGPQIGNSLKSIFTRLYDADSIKFLEEFNGGVIKIRDEATNSLLPAIEIMRNLGAAIENLPKEQQLQIVKDLSGLYQVNASLSLLTEGFRELNKQQSIYDRTLNTSKNAGNAALEANAKLSEILASKFNALNVQIGELLNSFGKLGVADPLSGFLDVVSWIVDNLKGAAENTDFLSRSFQVVAKVLGGAVFSKAGLVAIGVIIGKIAKDFVAFGLEAGRSFLGLNKAARDQAAIQQSIAAYIQQSGQNLNVLLNSEQARLNLTKQIAAAWNQSVLSAQQMEAVTKRIAVPIFNQGIRVGPTGPYKKGAQASEGFMPLVNAEMNDVKRGVGGANPNSKIVVMPNFPFGGGKRGMMVANSSETLVDYGGGKYGIMNPDMMAGRAASGFLKGQKPRTTSGSFASVANLESGLEDLAQLLVGLGKGTSEITNAATNFAKSFNLNEKSLSLVVSATEKYAVSLKQTAVRLEEEAVAESRRIALGKADQTIRSAPEKRAAFLDAPILPTASGKFIERPSPKDIERALKESSEILTKEIADAAYQEIYNGILRKRQEILEYVEKNPPNPLAFGAPSREILSGIETSSGVPRYDSRGRLISSQMGNVVAGQPNYFGNPTFSHLNQPIRNPLSPQSADPLTRAQEIGRLRELERIKNQPRGLSNASSILAAQEDAAFRQRIKESTSRSNSLAAFGAAQRISAEKEFLQSNAPKGFDPEAFNKFAAKAFIGVAALEGFTSALRGSSEGLDKTLDIVNKAAFAFTGAAALQQFGGFKITDLSDKILGLFGKGGGIFSKIGGFLAPLVRFTPVIGQLGIGLTLVNSVIEDLTGKSGLQRLKEALGGVSLEAEKAREKFEEIASEVFNPKGEFVGQTRQQAIDRIKTGIREIETKREAQALGVREGTTTGETQANLLRNRIQSILRESKTGRSTVVRDLPAFTTEGPELPTFSRVEENLANISETFNEEITALLFNLSTGTEEELKNILSEKGVKEIGGTILKDAKIDQVRSEIVKNFIEFVNKTSGGFVNALGKPFSTETQLKLAERFLSPKGIQNKKGIDPATGKPIPTTPLKVSQERVENLLEVKSLEQEILTLEELSLKTQLRTGELTDLEEAKREAMLRVLENERTERQKIIDLVGDSVRAYGKADLAENVPTSALTEIEKKIQSFNGDAEQARALVQEIAASFAPDKAKELVDIFESGNRKLEAQKKTRADILKQTNDQAIKEAGILQTLERQRGLVQAKLSLDQSQRSLQRGARENEASALEARASGVNVGVLESESLRRQALRKRQENIPSLIQDIQDEHENQLLDLNKKLISSPEDKSIGLQIQALNNATQERIDALKAESAALDENIRTLGEIPGFLKEFGDQLVNFEKSLPSSAAQNKFNLLQSTDAQSRIGGLISQQVFRGVGITEPPLSSEDQSRANLAAQISDQNALLLEQSKIRTAVNASEKLELETQYELTKQILEIKKQGLSPLEEQLKIEQAINANLKDRQTFGFGVRQASAEAQTRMQNFSSDFGKTAFDGFRDGLSDAIKAAVSQTDNLKSALLDVALAFANKLRDKAIDNLADVISNSLFSGGQSKSSGGGIVSGIVSAIGGFFGGGVQKRATGGMITGGTGTKDDVPTLLMGGEYVVPKNIVRQYGKGFFDRLRDGSVGKMAQGGYFAPGIRGQGTISGKENLLDFATQTATSGKGDLISSLSANAGLVSLEPESLRLTNFARFGDSPLVAATQDAKDQAFQLYLGQLEDEKAYAEYQAQLKKAEKEKKKQLWTSLAIAAVGAGLNYYGFGQQTASKSKETSFSGGRIRGTSERPNLGGSAQETAKGSYLSGLFKATAYGLSSIDPTTAMDQSKANAGIRGYKGFSQTVGASGRKLIPGFSVASNYFPQGTMLSINGQTFRVDDTGGMSKNIIDFFAGGDRGLYQKYSNWGGVRVTPIGRNSGGYSMGNGDTIPTMLSQDEFVLNKSATRKIGDKNLYALNNGAMPSGDNGSSAVVVAKLDELIEKTIGASNVTVNVTMNGGEEKSSNQNSDGQGDQNPRMLVQRIKEVVIGVIRDEQRPGGSLTKTR